MQTALLNQDQDTGAPQGQSSPAAPSDASLGQPVGHGTTSTGGTGGGAGGPEGGVGGAGGSAPSSTPFHLGTWDSPPASGGGGASGVGGGHPPAPHGGQQHATSWLPDWPMAPATTSSAAAAAASLGGAAPPEIELQPIEQPSLFSGRAMLWDQPARAAVASSPMGAAVTASRLPHTPGYPSGSAGSYGGGGAPPRSTASASSPSHQSYAAVPQSSGARPPSLGVPYSSGTPSLGASAAYSSMPRGGSQAVPAPPSLGRYPPASLAAASMHGSLRYPPGGVAYASPSGSYPAPASSFSAPSPQQRLSWPTHTSSSPQQPQQRTGGGYHGSSPTAAPAAASRPAAPWREEAVEAETSPWACQVGTTDLGGIY